jgi:two-component system CheB/CheR fusion protein
MEPPNLTPGQDKDVADVPPAGGAQPPPSYVVGIGASAGGLEALEMFFQRLPAQTGMAFVVIQHLSPDFKSLTNELLARRTSLPIHPAEDGMVVQPDAVYLLPPRKDMIISNGKLLLTDKDPNQLLAMPIDHFFRSLAQDAGERAVGIILSGTGSDGSRGIRDIRDAGGLVFAQTPESAQFDGMPTSAAQTGAVDFTLPPGDMPQALLRAVEQSSFREAALKAGERPVEGGMEMVFRMLRDGHGIDFRYYKPATVVRRIERRLLLNNAPDLQEYIERLTTDPEELNELYKDLLIGVTRFFRDREAFESLEFDLLPNLLQQCGEECRVWVAGCATGEEAYSLAILLKEQAEALSRKVPIKVFASDVHRTSLEAASAGVFAAEKVADLPPERLARYFLRRPEGYQVAPEVRKMVVFAHHNVLKDAPFTKLDLISCRNLLIYLEPAAQKKVLSLFHFGLRPGGTLFLGPSETPGELEEEFEALDAHWKLYRKRRDIRLAADLRLNMGPVTGRQRPGGSPALSLAPNALLDIQLLGTYDALLDECMGPSLLVSDRRELIQAFAGGSAYLIHKDGRYANDVLEMAEGDLRMALAGALQRVFRELRPVSYKGVRVPLPAGERVVNVTVKPIRNRRSGAVHAHVNLEPEAQLIQAAAAPEDLGQASREHFHALELELRYTKENLQATIEELETSNEELQATNEELVASNEELQSTNEELHSVNEELHTVNAEHQKKITELIEMTTDMENLLTSTEVHTIFLDKQLRIRKFTPLMGETFNLLPQDVGRRIDGFTHSIDHPGLLEDLRAVLQSGQPRGQQVRNQQGDWFLLRVLPYRAGGAVEGVVLTLIDIAGLKRAEAEASLKDRQLSSILRNSPNLVFITDREGRYVLTDESFRRMAGRDPVGRTAYELFPRETAEQLTAQDDRILASAECAKTEVVLPGADGPHTYLSFKFPLNDEQGSVMGIGGIQTDVTPLKDAERRALEAVTQRDQFLAMLSHELRNPLAAILNATSTVERAGLQAPGAAEWFRIIARRARHMGRLLDDLLDVCRITQNKMEMRKRVFDLATTVAEVVEEVKPWLEGKQLQLSLVRPEEVLLVEGDPARLQQIQVNLLMNAAKFTPAGGRIWYGLTRETGEAVVRVRDTGRGIAPEMQKKVFDLFVQGDTSLDRAKGGMGVGLTLVRSIVQLHGGRVEVFSDGVDKGCEFVLHLPLAGGPAPAEEAPDERDGLVAPPSAAVSLLVVEDDADIRSLLAGLLRHDGYEVEEADDGPAALAALERRCPRGALVDIGLPGMNGYELARAIRQRHGPEQVRLIALTGYGQTADRQAAREAGFDAHLTKPVTSRDLNRTLQAIFHSGTGPNKEATQARE